LAHWGSKQITKGNKRNLCKALALSILLYNSETWTPSELQLNKLKSAYDSAIRAALNLPRIEAGRRRGSRASRGSEDSATQQNTQDNGEDGDSSEDDGAEESRKGYDSFALANGFKPLDEDLRERRLVWLGHEIRRKNYQKADRETWNMIMRAKNENSDWWKQISKDLEVVKCDLPTFEKEAESGAQVKKLLRDVSKLEAAKKEKELSKAAEELEEGVGHG
jgi:hypothetical protein